MVKKIWAAGSWDEQRAAFLRLSEREQVAAWAVMTDIERGPVTVVSGSGKADAPLGPCRDQEVDQCDYAPAPEPSPTAKPRTEPSKPPVVTPPHTECTWERAYVPYRVAGEDDEQSYMFVYASQLNWCFLTPSVTGPLTDYSSYSFAANCCKFPWRTESSRYIDKLTALPASNTQKIQDHHQGYFVADADTPIGSAALTNTPNLDAAVGPDGSYVCNG